MDTLDQRQRNKPVIRSTRQFLESWEGNNLGKGTVSKYQRVQGLTWFYRYHYVRPSDGKICENKKAIGLVKDIGTSENAAWREVGRLGLDKNIDQGRERLTFGALAEHYRQHELRKTSGIRVKAEETKTIDELNLVNWVLPRWGDRQAGDIKPLEIEKWFEALTSPKGKKASALAWGTVGKIKTLMSQIFRHAQRHELLPTTVDDKGRPTNPVSLARSESGSSYEAVIVTPEQMIVILNELDTPETRLEWTLALVHAATALRPEEAFGLKWMEIDWKNSQIHISRCWSKGKETPGKTKDSMTRVAMHPVLAEALKAWRRETPYHRDTDWVFASSKAKGRIPRSAGICGQDYLRPAAVKAGVIPEGYNGRFGWHNLRHSLATFLAANEVNLPVIQSILRHAKPTTTAIYTRRVNEVQLSAQAMYLEAIKVKTAVV